MYPSDLKNCGNVFHFMDCGVVRRNIPSFSTPLVSGGRPVRKLVREGQQCAMLVYARSNTSDDGPFTKASKFGVMDSDKPYAALRSMRRSSMMTRSTLGRTGVGAWAAEESAPVAWAGSDASKSARTDTNANGDRHRRAEATERRDE
jgi:hypothetical protein